MDFSRREAKGSARRAVLKRSIHHPGRGRLVGQATSRGAQRGAYLHLVVPNGTVRVCDLGSQGADQVQPISGAEYWSSGTAGSSKARPADSLCRCSCRLRSRRPHVAADFGPIQPTVVEPTPSGPTTSPLRRLRSSVRPSRSSAGEVTRPEHGRASADLVPRGLIIKSSGVGHLSALDGPEPVAEEMADHSGRPS
jgi:hypothetical protein